MTEPKPPLPNNSLYSELKSNSSSNYFYVLSSNRFFFIYSKLNLSFSSYCSIFLIKSLLISFYFFSIDSVIKALNLFISSQNYKTLSVEMLFNKY